MHSSYPIYVICKRILTYVIIICNWIENVSYSEYWEKYYNTLSVYVNSLSVSCLLHQMSRRPYNNFKHILYECVYTFFCKNTKLIYLSLNPYDSAWVRHQCKRSNLIFVYSTHWCAKYILHKTILNTHTRPMRVRIISHTLTHTNTLTHNRAAAQFNREFSSRSSDERSHICEQKKYIYILIYLFARGRSHWSDVIARAKENCKLKQQTKTYN